MDENDELLVVDAIGDPRAWVGFTESGSKWLLETMSWLVNPRSGHVRPASLEHSNAHASLYPASTRPTLQAARIACFAG
jgi:hypothetical protein